MSAHGLSLIVHAGDFGRVHYALVLAAAAAAISRPVMLFFTGEAVSVLKAVGADGHPGWHALEGGAKQRDSELSARGVATLEALLGACAELGVRFMVCETALRAADVDADHLRTDVAIEVTGAVTFLTEAPSDGTTLFI